MRKSLKMNKIRIFVLLLFLVLVSLISMCCSSTRPKTERYWNEHFMIGTEKNIIFNALSVNDRLYVMTIDYILIYDKFDRNPLQITIDQSNSFDYRPLMSRDFAVYLYPWKKDYVPFRSYAQFPSEIDGFSPVDLGEEFKDFTFDTTNTRRYLGAVNSKNRYVTWITGRKANDEIPRYTYFVYIDVHIDEMGNTYVVDKGFWTNKEMSQRNVYVPHIISYQDKFYISARSFYQGIPFLIEISEDGEMIEIQNPLGMPIRLFFEYKGYLFARLQNGAIIYTTDAKTWYNWLYLTGGGIHELIEIDEYLFVWQWDRVYFFSEFYAPKFYRLPVENLAGREITSVNKYRDDLVITTTSGIFYKPFNEVMNDRILVSDNQNRRIHIGE